MPVVPIPEPETIPLGAEETLFYEDYFPGQFDRSIGTFFDRSVFDENAEVWRVSSPEGVHSIVAYVDSKVWDDYKVVRSLGVWFGEHSCYNRFSTEYPIPEPSEEEKYKRWDGSGHLA